MLLAFILFNKAAPLNYYWLAAFSLALGIVFLAAEESQAGGAAQARQEINAKGR